MGAAHLRLQAAKKGLRAQVSLLKSQAGAGAVWAEARVHTKA